MQWLNLKNIQKYVSFFARLAIILYFNMRSALGMEARRVRTRGARLNGRRMGRLGPCGDNATARPGGGSFVWFPGVGERPNFYSLTKWKKRTAQLSKASAAVGNLFTDMVEPKQIVAKMSKSL